MTKEVFENLQRQIEDHLAAIPREKTRFPDKNVSILQYVEVELKSLLTQPADVQESAREYADKEQGDNKEVWVFAKQAVESAYLAGASSLQAENERLRELVKDAWYDNVWSNYDNDIEVDKQWEKYRLQNNL